MNPYSKQVNYAAIEDSKKLQRLLALDGIKNSTTSKGLNRSDMMRLFRITSPINKINSYFDTEEFIRPII